MTVDIFEELLRKTTIFKDESKLDINFIPNKLPHRDKELSLLSQLFLVILTNPNSISRKILITGQTGIGKTVTLKLFGKLLKEATEKRNILFKYIHINCRKERTDYKVLTKIIRSIENSFPKRGYSPQDLLEIISDLLIKKRMHLLIVLDELSYLIGKEGDLIYSLTRFNDDSFNFPQQISLIGVIRDISSLNNLDTSTLSTLQRNIINFQNYSKKQIIEILKYRAELSLKENSINDDLFETISEIVYNIGDIRYGLNLLWRAGKIAESQNLDFITHECVRLGSQDIVPFITQDFLKYLSIHKLLFLLAIAKSLQQNHRGKVSFIKIVKLYFSFCENLTIKSRAFSQLWNYLQEFRRENIIFIKIISKNIKGRKSLIEIPHIPLNKLEENIINLLTLKGINF